MRPFIRVAGNLSLSVSELSASIPPFNAQKMLAQSEGITAAAEDAGTEPDAEVSFVTRDLTAVLPRAKVAAVMSIDDVLMRVRDALRERIPSLLPVNDLVAAREEARSGDRDHAISVMRSATDEL